MSPKVGIKQARLCDCSWNPPAEGENPWHTKVTSCPSVPELTFWRLIEHAGLPAPEREFRFHPIRRWRFDYAFLGPKLAVEIEGGTWQGGRHSRGAGYEADAEKQNTALGMGWRLVRYTPGMLKDGEAVVELIRKLLDS
jgi:very-short-patch-repair endonuclease